MKANNRNEVYCISGISIIYGLVIGRVKDLWSSARVVVLQKIGVSCSNVLSEKYHSPRGVGLSSQELIRLIRWNSSETFGTTVQCRR